MSERDMRRYVGALLRGRRPHDFRPDPAEAEELRAAIELRAARGDDTPDPDFVDRLGDRLAESLDPPDTLPVKRFSGRRRQFIAGTSIAAAAAATGVVADRVVTASPGPSREVAASLVPTNGTWLAVAASSDVTEGMTRPFDVGTVTGFVRRVRGAIVGVSGVCTHQGCRLWFDSGDDRLRCPCHSTSFTVTGQVLTHQLPVSPAPLPQLQVRENAGVIEVFAPAKPA
ncbi:MULTISPECIES: ubiquinol-cytochrome c reductase iron-sulfur subunit [unclassified Nocardia]|uniref:QcrA and Rieske domain-containing protein n=1 Tax=unclassified Nocardia TaxID=2637762 RepID=UPI001CE3FDBE|nr:MULTISPECIES: Rieske 2Fe-2S domain-containing protein [unclassified Nocardia]